ncbi:uncharacterized protein [Dermacentor andersoni]|uniref:uncharacterized protein n=1 Tax=Dermacentor andersoni TaxID=34620 RepID=UPI003B3A7546
MRSADGGTSVGDASSEMPEDDGSNSNSSSSKSIGAPIREAKEIQIQSLFIHHRLSPESTIAKLKCVSEEVGRSCIPYVLDLRTTKQHNECIDDIIRKATKRALDLPVATCNAKLSALGVLNSYQELKEAHLVNQYTRLSQTVSGRRLLDDLHIQHECIPEETCSLPEMWRHKLCVPPLPRNKGTQTHEGRRKARAQALEHKYASKQGVYYVDVAEPSPTGFYMAVVVKQDQQVNVLSYRGFNFAQAEEVAIALAASDPNSKAMVAVSMSLALVCYALAWPQAAQSLALHKTKRTTTQPSLATRSAFAMTGTPLVNTTVPEDEPHTRKPLKDPRTASGHKSLGAPGSVPRASIESGSNESEPLRGPWSGSGESSWHVSGSGQSGSGWSSSANDTAGSGSGWGWGSSGDGDTKNKDTEDPVAGVVEAARASDKAVDGKAVTAKESAGAPAKAAALDVAAALAVDKVPDKVAALAADKVPDKVAALAADKVPDKVAALAADKVPDKVAALAADKVPDKVAALAADKVPDKVAALAADKVPDKVGALAADKVPDKVGALAAVKVPDGELAKALAKALDKAAVKVAVKVPDGELAKVAALAADKVPDKVGALAADKVPDKVGALAAVKVPDGELAKALDKAAVKVAVKVPDGELAKAAALAADKVPDGELAKAAALAADKVAVKVPDGEVAKALDKVAVKVPAGELAVVKALDKVAVKVPAGELAVVKALDKVAVMVPAGELAAVKVPAGELAAVKALDKVAVKVPAGELAVVKARDKVVAKVAVKVPAGELAVVKDLALDKVVAGVDEVVTATKDVMASTRGNARSTCGNPAGKFHLSGSAMPSRTSPQSVLYVMSLRSAPDPTCRMVCDPLMAAGTPLQHSTAMASLFYSSAISTLCHLSF